ncbi:MAG: hypothetical protein VB016_06090 [Methanomassiliicoccaceae archaeon]|nr:hypothetical protein [Methanomassiliicoccaceae archaeon]
MVEVRRGAKMDFIDVQKKFLEENGVAEEDGNVLSKLMVLLFETGTDGKFSCNTGTKKISLDWNSKITVLEKEIWICKVTMKTNFLGYAEPVRKIEVSEIMAMSGDMQAIANNIWSRKKKEVLEYLAPEVDSTVEQMVKERVAGSEEEYGRKQSALEEEYEGRRSALEAEYQAKSSRIESIESMLEHRERNRTFEMEERLENSEKDLRERYEKMAFELQEKLNAVKFREEKLINEKSAMMSYYESQNHDLRKKAENLSFELSKLRAGAVCKDDSDRKAVERTSSDAYLLRISGNEFKSPIFKEGRYSVRINSEMTKIRFTYDNMGFAICRNGIIAVPGLNSIEALGNRIGELNWAMVDDKTVEISI